MERSKNQGLSEFGMGIGIGIGIGIGKIDAVCSSSFRLQREVLVLGIG
jgi:hypothetical protein